MSTTTFEAVRKTVLVDFAPEQAFDLFTAGIATWWPVGSHSYGGDDVTTVVFEPQVGGRVYEVTPKGERDWANVRELDRPNGFVLEWLIGQAAGTEVEVRFTREGPGSRVELEHRGFAVSDTRENYLGGWDVVLAPYVAAGSR
ncbi:MAG TPA: SRPBCC domain-containing protein [Gaiellaceae bacterium]|nr:SRPBCC domain-containing protein [Gaiellaceae bacterium]